MFPIPPFVVEDEKIVMETNLIGKKKCERGLRGRRLRALNRVSRR